MSHCPTAHPSSAFSNPSVPGAASFAQPDSTTERESEEAAEDEGNEEEEEEGEGEGADGAPNAAELRRRRLRKLDTTPPPDH